MKNIFNKWPDGSGFIGGGSSNSEVVWPKYKSEGWEGF
jgi:hypothetical protein